MPLVMPFDFYDPIGNCTSATDYDEQGNPLVSSYTANALNQYTQRTVPGYAVLRGEAATNATVTVNERPVWRINQSIGGSAAPTSARSGGNLGGEAAQTSPQSGAYDADGNMTSDGRFHYFWNGENRLVCASNAEVVVTYAYDHRGRMVRKEIAHRGTEARRIEYRWDDCNIIRVSAVQKMMARIIRPLKANAQNSIIDVEEANYAVRL